MAKIKNVSMYGTVALRSPSYDLKTDCTFCRYMYQTCCLNPHTCCNRDGVTIRSVMNKTPFCRIRGRRSTINYHSAKYLKVEAWKYFNFLGIYVLVFRQLYTDQHFKITLKKKCIWIGLWCLNPFLKYVFQCFFRQFGNIIELSDKKVVGLESSLTSDRIPDRFSVCVIGLVPFRTNPNNSFFPFFRFYAIHFLLNLFYV